MGNMMIYLNKDDSAKRRREAQNARDNRAEVVKALSTGEATRRDMIRWGIYTAAGTLAVKHGLSPYAYSQVVGNIPTGVPRSPLYGVQPFTMRLNRLNEQKPQTLTPVSVPGSPEVHLVWPTGSNEPWSKRTSWHTEYSALIGRDPVAVQKITNPKTNAGPMEGRPPGEYFAHQRWTEYLPKKGYVMNLGCPTATKAVSMHPGMAPQAANKVWSFGAGKLGGNTLPAPLLKLRYGEPVVFRHYNNLPVDEAQNGGFGSNNQSTHNHNGHNASTSDGASNAFFFPGQFYDYHWTTTLARADMTNTGATDPRASGPDGKGGLVNVPGDYRELQGSLWFHDHRFFYTAENVYKGHCGMINYYSGKDRGNETLTDGVNLRLPSGSALDYGNTDFDVNLMFSDGATDPNGQLFFDVFTTEGFLGDMVFVNHAYKPFMDVLPRKYRFRMLAASMSRWYKFALVNQAGTVVPMQMIGCDGNFLPSPVTITTMDTQGTGERFDMIVDFSKFRVGDKLRLVNLLEFSTGRGPDGARTIAEALSGKSADPVVGPVMEFRVSQRVESGDVPGMWYDAATHKDPSLVPARLTDPIPIVAPVRERVITFNRGGDTPFDGPNKQCFPSCPTHESWPWTLSVNGAASLSENANRVSILYPKPGEVEHWTLKNGGGGWDHPAHLHFEEGVTISRKGSTLTQAEATKAARKDVWWMGPSGSVTFQVRFGEYGGAYVQHCHNTVHEDASMLLRYDILTDPNNPKNSQTHTRIIPTPNPTPLGVTYLQPEIMPEGNPFSPTFNPHPKA